MQFMVYEYNNTFPWVLQTECFSGSFVTIEIFCHFDNDKTHCSVERLEIRVSCIHVFVLTKPLLEIILTITA